MTICVWDGIAACIVGDKEALERKGLLPFSLRYSQSRWVSYVSAIMVGELRQQELHQLEHRQLDLFPGSQEAEREREISTGLSSLSLLSVVQGLTQGVALYLGLGLLTLVNPA